MGRKFRKIALLSAVTLMSLTSLVGCSSDNKIKEAADTYNKAWAEKDFEGMYNMLSSESKEYVSQDDFVNRYSGLYSSIGISTVKVEEGENKDNKSDESIPLNVSMDTSIGSLKFDDYTLTMIEEDKEYKVKWDESLIFPDMQKDDKVKLTIEKGERGSIYDRNDSLLAGNGEAVSVGIHPRLFNPNKEANITSLASTLDISEEYIVKKLDANTNEEHLVPIVNVAKYENEKVQALSSIEGIVTNYVDSRIYAQGEAYGNLIGYVGNITAEELEENKDRGYSSYSTIGKNGLESVYEDKLRSVDGGHLYIDRNGEKITIAQTEPTNGEDITLTIDAKLQAKLYSEMNKEKGAATAIDPKTGEVLAMVSSPSYDSNNQVTYKTKTQAKEYEEMENAHFAFRANDNYSPASTMKLVTSSIALEKGKLDPNEKISIDGLNWQNNSSWGDYEVTRVKDTASVNLEDAVKYSDNIYFAQKSLEVGAKDYIEGAKKFGIGEELKFEYPLATSQISNSGSLDKEVLLADSGYGQGEVLVTPLHVAMMYSSLGNNGNIMQPRLVIGENDSPSVYKEAISKEHLPTLVSAFSSVINDPNGTGASGKIDGVNLAGKTGTAEIKASKDDENGREQGWFVAVDTDNSKLCVSMVIDDVKGKGGSEYVVPKVKNAMEFYLSK